MTDHDRINNIKNIKEDILADNNMDADKQKDALRGLERAFEALSRTDGYYVDRRKIKKIESRIATPFSLFFLITLFASTWGIPGIIDRSSDSIFYISLVSLTIWMLSPSIAPRIFALHQRFFKPKSS